MELIFFRPFFRRFGCFLKISLPLLLVSCAAKEDTRNRLVVSVKDQQMLLVRDKKPVKVYPISTSKFGLGTQSGSSKTPLGNLEIARKIGDGAPAVAVFKNRRRTGEVLKPNAPGRDPIVSRILWLRGLDRSNRNTYGRYIYIHGTPEEYRIGAPASYGCIRMKSDHVIDLFKRVGEGADVRVMRGSLNDSYEGREYYARRGLGRFFHTAARY